MANRQPQPTTNTPTNDTWWIIDPTKFQDTKDTTKYFFNGTTGTITYDPPPSALLAAKELIPPQPLSLYDDLQQSSRKFWKANSDNTKGVRLILAGGIAGAAAKTCVAPLERIKMLLQVHGMTNTTAAAATSRPPGLLNMAKEILMVDGPVGFWRGNVANVVRIIPTKGILFACNDQYRVLYGVDPKNPDPLRLMASGASAGMTSTLLTYPLDLVRSRLMMISASASATQGGAHYTGILDCFVKTYRQEGVRGLYGGLGPTLTGIIPYAGVSFAAFDVIKEYMPRDEHNKIATQYKLLCGAIAGFLSQSVSYPVDTVRRRMQLQGCTGGERLYKNAIDCTAQVFRKEGLFAFYRGLSANLLRAAPNTAIQFTAYEQICHWLNLKK